MTDLRITPVGDLIDHDTSTDSECVCGPTDQPTSRDDGSISWLAIHHSLDGRERADGENTLTVLIDGPDIGDAS